MIVKGENDMSNIESILRQLREGKLSILTPESIEILNTTTMKYLENRNSGSPLAPSELHELDNLLRICNILYNRTDIEVLPVEDGIYDILLEYYKKFNPNYQVGSEVIDFTGAANNIITKKDPICPIIEFTDEEIKKMDEGLFYDDLRINPEAAWRVGYYRNPEINTGYIEKRKHNTSNNHPSLVGTLDKAKFVLSKDALEKGVLHDSNVAVLERDFFFEHIKKGIILPGQKLKMVLELKYDGISVEADCDNFVRSARTRGDTGIGQAADITPLLEGYAFQNANGLNLGEIGIKFEAIMLKEDLYKFNIARNTSYKNCRTAIVGLFGASDGNLYRNYITLVPLGLDRESLPSKEWNRQLEIEFLNKYYATNGCPLRYSIIEGDYKECLFQIQAFLEEAEVARKYLNFMYDGIVVSYLDEDIREKLGRVNHVNKYSMAVKFNPLRKSTRFTHYTFHVGQNGSITPKIHYEPVEFFGSIHPQSTGNSYARFKELNLRVGDIIEVAYINDVIDRVEGKVNCLENMENAKHREPVHFTDKCPVCGAPVYISDTGKTAYCSNIQCPGRELARVVNMMGKLNLKDFGEAKIAALNVHSLREMMSKTRNDLLPILGEAFTEKFLERMNTIKTESIPDYMIVGALGFTGIATGKWKLIFERMTLEELVHLYRTNSLKMALQKINGIGDSISDTIIAEFPIYEDDINMILAMPNIIKSFGKAALPKVVFTGFRDAGFADYLNTHGYDYKENLTKDTAILVIPAPGFNSTKLSKVGPNTRIISREDFQKEINYL